jgi:hypothetical protein
VQRGLTMVLYVLSNWVWKASTSAVRAIASTAGQCLRAYLSTGQSD